MTATGTKTCATCRQEKPVSEFGTRPNGKGGIYPRAHCRPCMNTAQRDNTAAKAHRNARMRTARAAARAEVVIEDRDMVPDYKLREEWTHFHSLGVPDEQIARLLGYQRLDSMHQALHRAGIRKPAHAATETSEEAA